MLSHFSFNEKFCFHSQQFQPVSIWVLNDFAGQTVDGDRYVSFSHLFKKYKLYASIMLQSALCTEFGDGGGWQGRNETPSPELTHNV